MNIFRVFTTILYPFFIYLLLFSRRNLLESTDTSASHNPATDGSGQVATTPANPNGSSSASGGSGNATGGGTTTTTPTSGGGTKGSGTKTGVELSLKATAPTDQFDHNKNDKIVTFTAKDNHGFKSVETGDKLVWETTNTNEYASKVILDGKGQKKKTVVINIPNNTIKVLKREGKGKEWKDATQPGEDTANVASGTKKDPKEINIKDIVDADFYKIESKGNHRTFTAETGFAFNRVKEDDTYIWKTDKESEYANKIEVDDIINDAKAVTIYLAGNKTRIFKKGGKNEPWKEIDTSKVNPRTVYINYPHDTYFYKNELKNKVRTFEPKTGFAFKAANEYIDGNKVEIWKTDKESEYANKVVNEGDAKVTIHLADGSTKVFNKGSDNNWTEDTQASTQKSATDGVGAGTTPSSGNSGTGFWSKISGLCSCFGGCGSKS